MFNVELLTFRRDGDGLAALNGGTTAASSGATTALEDGKMGDQKYLDDWPVRFAGVRVLEHPGGGLAPWNVTNHELELERPEHVLVDEQPLVFFHYHSLRLYRTGLAARFATAFRYLRPGVAPVPLPWTSNYGVPQLERQLVWDPYLRAIGLELELLREVGTREPPGVQPVPLERTWPCGRAARSPVA